MPLLRFDILEGRSPDQLKALLNATHSALVAAFRIPDCAEDGGRPSEGLSSNPAISVSLVEKGR